MNEESGVVICDPPQEAEYGAWLMTHPECDTVIQQIGTGATILVYAYAVSGEYNGALEAYRDSCMPEYDILMGVTVDGIRSVI